MVEHVDWLAPVDYAILEFFEEYDIMASPKVIAVNVEYDRRYIGKQCRTLAQLGLLGQDSETGLYELTSSGRAFVEGELDAEELQPSVV